MRRQKMWLRFLFIVICLAPVRAQQEADPDYKARVERPAFSGEGPRVLFDEAHHNFHTGRGRYKPFADLIAADGFASTSNMDPFRARSLRGFQVLVIANARGSGDDQSLASRAAPAFTEAECDAVRDWVREGGALLLVSDHWPPAAANGILARRFGIDMA